MKKLILLAALPIILTSLMSQALAQAGHPLNSVDTTPGTSVPLAPTDPTLDPEKTNDGLLRLPKQQKISDTDMDREVNSIEAKPIPNHPVKTDQQAQKASIFPNDKNP